MGLKSSMSSYKALMGFTFHSHAKKRPATTNNKPSPNATSRKDLRHRPLRHSPSVNPLKESARYLSITEERGCGRDCTVCDSRVFLTTFAVAWSASRMGCAPPTSEQQRTHAAEDDDAHGDFFVASALRLEAQQTYFAVQKAQLASRRQKHAWLSTSFLQRP
ncbi:hypothetical protein B0H17DRAFT_1143463 [Mycena rosella]|uniref:Uncharacterized protein n=1 Tax=Mycena rosella TaxID=1033263 RepID=A0AAD7G6Q8_MYCRO|nr:hypothetical protein B0H17DRAFT_1143463 [Mycena rosella]